MATDAVAAFLADVRMQAEDHHLVPEGMVLPLVVAVEAALKLAGEWEQDARYLDARAEQATAGERTASVMLSGRAQAKKDDADELRTRITAALTGPQPGEDGEHG